MTEFGMDRALGLSLALTLFVVASAKLAGDVVRPEVPKVRKDGFTGIGHGFGRRLVTEIGSVKLPDVSDGMRTFPVALPPEDIYRLCFRFRSGACLKLIAPTVSNSGLAPVDAEASSVSSDADVCCHVCS